MDFVPTRQWSMCTVRPPLPSRGEKRKAMSYNTSPNIANSSALRRSPPPPSRQAQATAPQGEDGLTDDFVTQVFTLFQIWETGASAPICYAEAKQFFQVCLCVVLMHNMYFYAVTESSVSLFSVFQVAPL